MIIHCDEGIYKKKYCNPEDRMFLSGIEFAIDELVNDFTTDSEDTDICHLVKVLYNDKKTSSLAVKIENNRTTVTLTKPELVQLLNTFKKSVLSDFEGLMECERGALLVGLVESNLKTLRDEEIVRLYENAEKTEYDDSCDPAKNSKYTYNSNGKPRPLWNEGMVTE